MTLFYCAHWQSYVSGTLRLGKVDVTEAQCMIMLIHLISAVFGPEIWMTKVFEYLCFCSVINQFDIFKHKKLNFRHKVKEIERIEIVNHTLNK